MTADEWKAYLSALQDNGAIDPQSLAQYASLVASLNATVRKAAIGLMQFEDEPARFTSALREFSR